MDVVSQLYWWTDHVLLWAAIALQIWAVVDCATRKSAAFEATNRLTKPGWLAILAVCLVLGYFMTLILALMLCIPAGVYLADVRPAVRQVSGGGSNW